MPGLYTAPHSATPATPAAGFSTHYPKSDDLWYYIDDNGNERLLLASTNTAIAANRVPYASATAGIFTSSANLTFDGNLLTLSGTAGLTITGATAGDYKLQAINTSATGLGMYLEVASNSDSQNILFFRSNAGATTRLTLGAGGSMALTGTLTVSGICALGGGALSSSTVLSLQAGTTGASSLRIPHGSAPTSPVDGDVWSTTTTLNFRLNGVTKSITMA